MLKTILGSKVNMSRAFVEGVSVPVTKITAGPCVVTQVKTKEKDGYWAVQLGFGDKKTKNMTKPLAGHLLKSQPKDSSTKTLPRFIREVRLTEKPEVEVGSLVKASDFFNVGDKVSVTGISKGKGFAGGVKRWHFAGGSKTHGQSDRWRAPGSIGQGTTPGRVYKGKHMAGRMGSEQIKIKGLKIVHVNSETNEIGVSGPVAGTAGTLLIIERIGETNIPKQVEENINA